MRGTHRPDRRRGEPTPEIAVVHEPPEWLAPIGREKWIEMAAKLEAVRVLTVNDLDALAMYCHAWAEIHECEETLNREGLTCTSDKGGMYQHPCVGIRNKAIQRLRQYGAAFGLTPADRTRVSAASDDKPQGIPSRKRA